MSRFRPKRLWRKRAFALAAALAAAQSVQAGGLFDTRADCNNGGAVPAIGTPTLAGTSSQVANPLTLTTTGTILAGSLIMVAAYVDVGGLGAVKPTGVTDCNGDTYTAVGTAIQNGGSPFGGMNGFTAHTGAGIAAGCAIKVTWNIFNGSFYAAAVEAASVTGASAVDQHTGGNTSGTFASQTVTPTKAPSLAIGMFGAKGTSTGTAAGFTNLTTFNTGSHVGGIQYQTTQSSGTSPVTFAPGGSGNNQTFDILFNVYAVAPAC